MSQKQRIMAIEYVFKVRWKENTLDDFQVIEMVGFDKNLKIKVKENVHVFVFIRDQVFRKKNEKENFLINLSKGIQKVYCYQKVKVTLENQDPYLRKDKTLKILVIGLEHKEISLFNFIVDIDIQAELNYEENFVDREREQKMLLISKIINILDSIKIL